MCVADTVRDPPPRLSGFPGAQLGLVWSLDTAQISKGEAARGRKEKAGQDR